MTSHNMFTKGGRSFTDLRNGNRNDISRLNTYAKPSFLMFTAKLIMFSIVSLPNYDLEIVGTMLGGRFSYTLDGIIMIISFHRLFFLINFWMIFNKWAEPCYCNIMKNAGVVKSILF